MSETDLDLLRRQLTLAQQRAAQAREDARQLAVQNRRLQETLGQARERLQVAAHRLEQMTVAPLSFATVLVPPLDGVAEVLAMGRRLRVGVDPELAPDGLRVGDQVVVNDALVVIATAPQRTTGEVATISELLDDQHVVVSGGGAEDQVVLVAATLAEEGYRHGDAVLVDRRAAVALRVVPREGVGDLVLEEVPDVTYEQIGGLSAQVQQVRDAVELPFLHRDLYRSYGLGAPKGVLLYGPPGTGKTMIAKAVASSLAASVEEASQGAARSYFLNVKGPELLSKYVGETERQIRVIFQRARERASEGTPVIVFFDEMDSLFRTRGSGVSSDVENTIVPQLLSEIDGVEGLENVIIIGASNREDMIDPAILRPGRLDVKIRLDRPDESAAREIFATYLTPNVPIHAEELARDGGDVSTTLRRLIDGVVATTYARTDENRFVEVTYASGETETLYLGDFVSGALIRNVVDRAKKAAVKHELLTGERGLTAAQLAQACCDELRENEDLPSTGSPEEWARISGRRGERVVSLRTLAS